MSRRPKGSRPERGQALVEFSIVVPVTLLILFGMLEFGTMFDHTLTLGYGSREGVRLGAALVNGGGTLGCGGGQSPNAATVDGRIIAAVQRILAAPGSPIVVSRVSQIRIYKATSTGGETPGQVNVWTYSATGTATADGTVNFAPFGAQPWTPCSRTFVWTVCGSPPPGLTQCPPDSIGVSVLYTYNFTTPLGKIVGFFGGAWSGSTPISDRTVMAMNPS